MFKKIAAIFLMILFVPAFLFVGCGKKQEDTRLFKGNEDFLIEASATQDKIVLDISNVKKPKGYKNKQVLDVVMLKPYEYYEGELDTGINYTSPTYADGELVGTYVVGTASQIKIDRYVGNKEDNNDNLYNKFVIGKGGTLVAGPFFVNDIASKETYAQKIVTNTKKGIFGEIDEKIADLGCGWTELNVVLDLMIFPNETVDSNGKITTRDLSYLDNDPAAIKFVSGGKTYYFKSSYVQNLDSRLIFYKERNIKTVLILLARGGDNQNDIPYFMTYPDAKDWTYPSARALFTANSYGFGYYTAAFEFLAQRYSDPDGTHGYAHRFVIGNEIDISSQWNPVANYDRTDPLPLDEYVEEYLRTLRLAEQATKKYYSDSMVLVSTCHYWAGKRNQRGTYETKAIYDYLNAKATYEGNFNWGMAAHPYPEDLTEANFLLSESGSKITTGDFLTTTNMTWTNFELLDLYLAQDQLKFNGQLRRVYLTEGGVSSGPAFKKEINYPLQAAGIAYAYFKCLSMDSVDAFIYYKLVDDSGDGVNANFGLLEEDDNLTEKPSYELYKYIDTQYGMEIADLYLSKIAFRKNGVIYNVSKGNVHSYKDIMGVCDSNFNWEVHWDTNKYFPRHIDGNKPEILQ